MKIENLKEKQMIKNYKELCNILNEKVLTGENKKIQLFNWESYFQYTRSGNSFIINEIYKKPKPILTEKYIILFLLKILYNYDQDKIKLDKEKLENELLKIKEDNLLYFNYKYNENIVSENFIYKNISKGLKNINIKILLNKALKLLKSQLLISFNDIGDYYEILIIKKEYLKAVINNILILNDYRIVSDREPSKAEQMIEDWLWKHKINYSFEYRLYDDDYSDINNKRFDFAIFFNNKLLCLLEYDGIQHFEPVEEFGGIKTFKQIQVSDAIKNKYCKDKNYKLIRIKYKDCCDENGNITPKLYDELNDKILPIIRKECDVN